MTSDDPLPPSHLPPPPDLHVPPVAADPSAAAGGGSTGRRWVMAVFVVMAVFPGLFIVAVGLGPDDTATGSAVGLVLVLTAIELAAGAVAAAITWAIVRQPAGTGRSFGLAAMLTIAGLWGLATGFLGGVAVSYERHPTWDDA